jgi:hypothetical protein
LPWAQQELAISSTLIISGHGLGKQKKPLFEDFSIPFPPDVGDGDSLTLRELITRIVLSEVQAFQHRQERNHLLRVLTTAQIEKGLEKGKVDMGGSDLKQSPKPDAAVASALQAFEDRLYLVVIDAEEKRDLDAQVFLQPGSRITFIRLVFLAGA